MWSFSAGRNCPTDGKYGRCQPPCQGVGGNIFSGAVRPLWHGDCIAPCLVPAPRPRLDEPGGRARARATPAPTRAARFRNSTAAPVREKGPLLPSQTGPCIRHIYVTPTRALRERSATLGRLGIDPPPIPPSPVLPSYSSLLYFFFREEEGERTGGRGRGIGRGRRPPSRPSAHTEVAQRAPRASPRQHQRSPPTRAKRATWHEPCMSK